MKLLTYIDASGVTRSGLSFGGRTVHSMESLGYGDISALDFIRRVGCGFSSVKAPGPTAEGVSISSVRLLSPIPRPERNVICVGFNYRNHVEESDRAGVIETPRKAEAVYFTKNVNEALAPGGVIDGHFDICDSLDYECELAVILGRDAYKLSPEEAAGRIFGFAVANDVTARNIQKGRTQWFFGKSLDTFFPFGPWIVTADELGTAPDLPIRAYVNGELRQSSRTGDLIHSAAEMISDLSQGITLPAGTILATGTPSGVGMGFTPPRYLRSGDTVRCEIDGIGAIENTVG